jgi:hypothetical protein
MLRANTAKGAATVISEEVSTGGKVVVRVLLDSNGEERVFLREFVTESDTPAPQAAKKARKPRAKKAPEPITDELLIDQAPVRAAQLDAVDVDELPEEFKNAAEETAEDDAE